MQDQGGTRKLLLVSAAITLALYVIPYGRYLARPLLLLSTLAHEMGHGLTALLLGGKFQRLEMWASGAGVSEIDLTGFGRIREGLTLAGGLVGPAVAAALCFKLGKTGRGARSCLVGLGIFLLAAEILVVRNLFGFFFAGLVAAGCLFAGTRVSPERAQWVVVFLGVQLALSVFSRADYLFTQSAGNPGGVFPSDVMRMQNALFLPYWFWGLVCGAFSVLVLAYGVRTCWSR
ncbi:MAG TPA: M50 family metallopeptidase [Thermoanaerobaculia bacterium]|nr:M50 family metallopeptidase [Thermoanaerobaculia bacterium]